MRTGMEPFFAFLETIRYAFEQIRIEYRNNRDYRRSMPRTSQYESVPTLSAKQRGTS